MISRIHKAFDIRLPLAQVFKAPTIKGMARYMEEIKGETDAYISIEPTAKKEYYPVSYLQKRLFLLHQVSGISTAYTISSALTVEGKLDREHLEGVICTLIRQHESLRTSFGVIGDEPVQIVHDAVEFAVESIDLPPGIRGFSNRESEAEAEVEVEEEAEAEIQQVVKDVISPFELEKAPLLRVTLGKMAREKHLMIFQVHHIISDGTSMAILVRDFIRSIQGEALYPLKLQYKDFCNWQTREQGKKEARDHEAYWLRQMRGPLPQLNLPTDFPRADVQSFAGERLLFQQEEEVDRQLLSLVKTTETTLYIVLLAICNILFNKYTGQEDIIIGTPVAGRDHVELEEVIGMFINALPMRNRPRPAQFFLDFLKEVKESTLEAFENQAYSFGKLIERLEVKKDLSRNPVYDIELIVQNLEGAAGGIEDLRFTRHVIKRKVTQVDIGIDAAEVQGRIGFQLTYCTGLYKKETMERLIDHFKEIIRQVTGEKGIKLGDICLSHGLYAAQGASLLEQDEGSDFGFGGET